jgi:Flp pilus assembly pilin Flp
MISATRTRARRGQGATESVVVVGLCALLLVSAVQAFRSSVSNAYNTATLKVLASSDPNNPALFPVSPDNPYRWNNGASRWVDADGYFVNEDRVRPYDDPDMYKVR